jgi:hypothetical protein
VNHFFWLQLTCVLKISATTQLAIKNKKISIVGVKKTALATEKIRVATLFVTENLSCKSTCN